MLYGEYSYSQLFSLGLRYPVLEHETNGMFCWYDGDGFQVAVKQNFAFLEHTGYSFPLHPPGVCDVSQLLTRQSYVP